MHIALHYIWFKIRDRIFQINHMLQTFLFPYILDLCFVKYMADTDKITDSNNGKVSYCRMSGSEKNEDTEFDCDGYD